MNEQMRKYIGILAQVCKFAVAQDSLLFPKVLHLHFLLNAKA